MELADRAGHSRLLTVALPLTGSLGFASWYFPSPNAEGVWGRYGYDSFVLIVVATGLFLGTLAVAITPSPKRRQIGFRLLAVFLGTVLPLFVWEAFAYVLPVRHPMDNPWYCATDLQADGDVPYTRPTHFSWRGVSRGDIAFRLDVNDPYAKPVTFQTDHEGFRNSRDLQQAEVVFLGDSFTEAGYLAEDETFVQRVGRELNCEVRNLGRNGFSPPSEKAVLEKYGWKCQPRIVVWQLTEDNDLNDAALMQSWIDAGRPSFFETQERQSHVRAAAWRDRSPTYRLFRLVHRRATWPLTALFRDAEDVEHTIYFNSIPHPQMSPVNHPGWPVIKRSLEEGIAGARERQIRVIVLFIPYKYTALQSAVEYSQSMMDVLKGCPKFEPDQTFLTYVERLCSESGVEFIDATPQLQELARAGTLTYLPWDTHLTAAGHACVAQRIVAACREKRGVAE